MKIVVLAGGISTERDVSLSSGSEIYKALKRKGHQVILVDLFLGLPGVHGHLEELFDSEIDWAASIHGVSEKAPDLNEVKARRPGYRSILGPNVLEILYSSVFMEKAARTAGSRHCSICMASATPEPGMPAVLSAWIRALPKKCSGATMSLHLQASRSAVKKS